MKLEFFGAAGEVTGSCHILRVGKHRILLDCGMIQGGRKAEKRNADPFPFKAGKIDAVVLSHAHIDHCGRLPLLVKRGFDGPIHCQNATRDLCEVLLKDSAYLAQMDAERTNRRRQRQGRKLVKPLYETADAERAMHSMRGHRYREDFEVVPGVSVCFYDAGHILGSCVVAVTVREGERERRIIFSGDLGQYDTPILRDPDVIGPADIVLMESTYGGRRHRDRSETLAELGEIITSKASRRGNLLIPAFAVGRSQELIYALGKNFREWNLERWQVFLDSPMAIEASKIYWDYPHLYDEEATRLRRGNNRMPPLPNLTLSRSADQSRSINQMRHGAIVLAGSGMCSGGRIIHHLKHNLWRRECQVLIMGYQAVGSLGRKLVDGNEYVKIHGQQVRVQAKVHTIGGLSAHGDEEDLSRWYGGLGNHPPVFLVHGEKKAGKLLRKRLKTDHGCKVTLADPGMTIDLETLRVIKPGKALAR